MTVFVALEVGLWLMCRAFITDPECRKGVSPGFGRLTVLSTAS
jgi:hypothetical protein